MKTSELAKKTLEALKQHGWTQGKLGNCRDGMCILGAAYYSIHDKDPDDGFTDVYADSIAIGLVREISSSVQASLHASELSRVVEWNDSPKRKFTEVAELLEKIANEQ